MKNVKSYSSLFAGTNGAVSTEVTPYDTTVRCDFFDDAYGLIDEEVSEKEETIEANKTLIAYLNEKLSKLQRLVKDKRKENNQREAEIQILKARADNETVLSLHEKHALAQWCFCEGYPYTQFIYLYFQCLPYSEIPKAFSDKCNQLTKKLKELTEVDPYSGRETLCRYPAISDGVFPIRAYEVACRRLGWRVDVPIFTWREMYSLDEINKAYLQLPEVKRGRERGAQLVDEYKRKHEHQRKPKTTIDENEQIHQLCNGVFADMPRATATEHNEEIRHRSIAIKSKKVSYSTADRWRKSTIKVNKERTLN